MWARSHTSGLMISVCWLSTSASLSGATSARVRSRASARASETGGDERTATKLAVLSADDALDREAAEGARARVEHARATFASSAGWKARSEGTGVRVFERRGATFDVAASTALPCSATEVLELLSSRDSDDFNASMVALAGDAFAHAVTLREVPTPSPDVHLTVK